MAKALSTLPVGALVKDATTTYNGKPIIWKVMEHGHSGDPAGTTALVTERMISLKAFDAIEAGNSDSNRRQYGNNRYLYSNLLRWLNSELQKWYAAQHSQDAAPTNANVWSNYNEYDAEKGFLANFSANMKAALKSVTKRTAKNTVTDGGGYEEVTSKIFLLSATEVGLANENNIAEGVIYELFRTAANRICKPTAEAVSKSEYTNNGLNVNAGWYWWLRTPYSSISCGVRFVYTDGSLDYDYAYFGNYGVRPACVIASSIFVSDAADTDGAYTILWNSAPTITTASESLGDKNTPFSFKYTITDADNDTVSATVKLDGTTIQTLSEVVLGYEYSVNVSAQALNALSARAHTYTITATDAYQNASTKTITFTKVASSVAISGSDTSIGTKWAEFSYKYQVTDAESKAITVKEYIDNELTDTKENVAQGSDIEFNLDTFAELTNEEEHTLMIEAINTDESTAYRTITFTKLADKLLFELKPIETDAPAEKIVVQVNYVKTGNPTLRVEATNCAYNAEVIWEDITENVINKTAYEFNNENFDAEQYGVAVRVTIEKNESTERVYCSGVGVQFD